MDSHYHQVMKARENSSKSGSRWYFGYSTVMDHAAFDEWRTQHSYQFFDLPKGQIAVAQDLDLVFDFPSRWWGGRVAGLQDKIGSQVYGLLFEIENQNWPIIQHKEGFITHSCIEREVQVLVDGKTILATAFTTAPNRKSMDGPISAAFLEAWGRGARSAGLNPEYIERVLKIQN